MNNTKIDRILNKVLAEGISENEKGEIYANFARLYLEAVNKTTRDYEVILDSAINILKDLNVKEKEIAAKLSANRRE